ncbi:MAG: hypothetical protein RLZZ558_1790 [Planctomycetota bacterium]|jgi:hypothetical protein
MPSSLRWLLLVATLAAGCRPYVMSNSAVEQYPGADDELDFLAAVERMPAVTNNDALHGFFLLQDGSDPHADFESRVAEGRRRGWFPMGTPTRANEAAKIGWMATAGCRVMDVRGGLSMNLLGPLPRFATRELVYMEILPLRTENQILTGGEFVDYLNRLSRIAGSSRRARPASPLGVPAGESAVSPGNEGAIQEGSLPEQGPREAPYQPPTEEPAEPPVPSQVPGTLRPFGSWPGGTTGSGTGGSSGSSGSLAPDEIGSENR